MIASIIVARGGPDGRERATRNHPLPAERLRRGAFAILNTVERGFRAIYPDAFFDGRRLAASGYTSRSRKLQVQPPIYFPGLGRALQPREQSRSGLTQTLHLPRSFRDAHAFHEHLATEGIAACAKKLSSRSISP